MHCWIMMWILSNTMMWLDHADAARMTAQLPFRKFKSHVPTTRNPCNYPLLGGARLICLHHIHAPRCQAEPCVISVLMQDQTFDCTAQTQSLTSLTLGNLRLKCQELLLLLCDQPYKR